MSVSTYIFPVRTWLNGACLALQLQHGSRTILTHVIVIVRPSIMRLLSSAVRIAIGSPCHAPGCGCWPYSGAIPRA